MPKEKTTTRKAAKPRVERKKKGMYLTPQISSISCLFFPHTDGF